MFIQSGLLQNTEGSDERDASYSNARALARLLVYAADEAKSLNATHTEALLWRCLGSLQQEANVKLELHL